MLTVLPTLIPQFLFWASLLALFSHFVLYPLLMVRIGQIARRKEGTATLQHLSDSSFQLPSVTVVIAALNEEKEIGKRVTNLLNQDYPFDKLQVLIGSDGSTDGTVAKARAAGDARVEVLAFKERRGKTAVLNELIEKAAGDIVVLTDANTAFERSAIRQLVQNFCDTKVGAVSGELVIQDDSESENVDSTYWSVEQLLKRGENEFGVVLGANGAIYAIRRNLYEPLPTDTIIDDFTVMFRIVRDGHRGIYTPRALAYEASAPDLAGEYKRRVRIYQGNFQFLYRYSSDFHQCGWRWRFAFFFHKVLRWYAPVLLIVTAICGFWLWQEWLYRLAAISQLLFHVLGAILAGLLSHFSLPRPLRLLAFINLMLLANLKGWFKFRFSAGSGAWERTAR